MEVTVHLDGDPAIRQEGFFASKVEGLLGQIHDLEFDNAELVKANEELAERVKKLATQRPSGYRPRRNNKR
jgi:cell division protein FtsB